MDLADALVDLFDALVDLADDLVDLPEDLVDLVVFCFFTATGDTCPAVDAPRLPVFFTLALGVVDVLLDFPPFLLFLTLFFPPFLVAVFLVLFWEDDFFIDLFLAGLVEGEDGLGACLAPVSLSVRAATDETDEDAAVPEVVLVSLT